MLVSVAGIKTKQNNLCAVCCCFSIAGVQSARVRAGLAADWHCSAGLGHTAVLWLPLGPCLLADFGSLYQMLQFLLWNKPSSSQSANCWLLRAHGVQPLVPLGLQQLGAAWEAMLVPQCWGAFSHSEGAMSYTGLQETWARAEGWKEG